MYSVFKSAITRGRKKASGQKPWPKINVRLWYSLFYGLRENPVLKAVTLTQLKNARVPHTQHPLS